VRRSDLPPDQRLPYLVCVQRAEFSERWECYPIGLRLPIGSVFIPLRRSEKDIKLDLQPLMDRVYVAGGHDDIDYSKPLDPPLSADDEAWADQLLRAAGRR
jgi:hypothetical protein